MLCHSPQCSAVRCDGGDLIRERKMPKIDHSGERYGRVTLKERVENRGHHAAYRVVCDCGNDSVALLESLRTGHTQSCGCLRRELHTTHGATSGGKILPEYSAWYNAKRRCHYTANPSFKNYGGRGIGMCEEWRDDFAAFFRDLGPRPAGRTLGRIDNDKGYEPGNCRWETRKQQQRNQRGNRYLECAGTRQTITEWADALGIPCGTLRYRLKRGQTRAEITEELSGGRHSRTVTSQLSFSELASLPQ